MTGQTTKNIGFIGAGNMGGAIINGLINSKYPKENIFISHPSAAKVKKYSHLEITNESPENNFVVSNCDVIFLCVKPQIIEKVCESISNSIDPERHIIMSVAAGVTLAKLEKLLNPTEKESKIRVVRCMLNTAALIGSSCSVYSENGFLTEEDKSLVSMLLKSTGPCMGEIKDADMDAAMAVLSCGIAYHFMMTDAMADGGVKMGLSRDMSLRLAMQTMKGASELMIKQYGIKHHMQMKDEVCSPGGTTIAGLHELEKQGFRNAVISTVEAACNKAKKFQ